MILALGICISVFVLLMKSGWLPRAVGHQAVTDAIVTLSLAPLIGADTLGGLAAVVWGGVLFSLTLFVASCFVTPEHYVRGTGWVRGPSPFYSAWSPLRRIWAWAKSKVHKPQPSEEEKFMALLSR